MPSVVVIGASLSGASLSLALARSGVDVCLVDRDDFPRAKACGEGLSSRGVAELEKLGLRHTLAALPCAPFDSFAVSNGNERIVIPAAAGPHDRGFTSVGIERERLDYALLSAALHEPLVRGRLGRAVRRVKQSGTKFLVQTQDETIDAGAVVLACGGNSGLILRKPQTPSRSGQTWKAEGEFRSPFHSVQIVLGAGHEIFFTRVGIHRLNISVLADRAEILRNITPAELLHLAAVHCNFFGAMICRPLGAGALTSFERPGSENGMLLIGDACEVFDPIGGMGMTHALLSAELAAASLLRWLGGTVSREAAFADYGLVRHRKAAPLRRFTKGVYFILKRMPPRLRSGALKLIAISGSSRAGAGTADRRSESTRRSASR